MSQVVGYTLPAFPGGINLVDPIDRTPDVDATNLINMYPSGPVLALRKGISTSWTAASAAAKTAATLVEADGTQTMVVACNSNLYKKNGTSSTAIKGTTTPTSDEWQHVTFNNRLYFVNGLDTAQVWTGTGNFADSDFTGVTLADLINVSAYKARLYFVEKDSGSIWYGNTNAVGASALTEFDVSYIFNLGGFVVSCGSYTDNLGQNTQDLFYILSSEGELLFYSGSYPGDSAWTLVARYVIGKPLGYRAQVRVENDLWFITDRGIVPTSILFSAMGSAAANSVSRKINPEIVDTAKEFAFSYLYSGIYYSGERKVVITIPVTSTSTKQLVYNVETGAWTCEQYAVAGANLCMSIVDGLLYCGANSGKVYQMYTGFNDDGSAISYTIEGGFNFFGNRQNYKVFKDIRPIIRTSAGALTIKMDLDTNFQKRRSFATITTPAIGDAATTEWDSGTWDTDPWSEEERYLFDRYSLRGQGHCGALRIGGTMIDALLEFNAFEIRFEIGSQV
jgi:hypothetical protein